MDAALAAARQELVDNPDNPYTIAWLTCLINGTLKQISFLRVAREWGCNADLAQIYYERKIRALPFPLETYQNEATTRTLETRQRMLDDYLGGRRPPNPYHFRFGRPSYYGTEGEPEYVSPLQPPAIVPFVQRFQFRQPAAAAAPVRVAQPAAANDEEAQIAQAMAASLEGMQLDAPPPYGARETERLLSYEESQAYEAGLPQDDDDF